MPLHQGFRAMVLLLVATAGAGAAGGDEALLKEAGVATNDAGLLRFLRNKAVPPQFDLATLTRQLGSNEFKEREEATRLLLAAGKFALPALREAHHDPDPEIARRVADCLAVIDKGGIYSPPDLASAAVRLVVRRAPPDAVAALLDYLPHAPQGEIEEEVWFALDALARQASTVPPPLVVALGAIVPARRAVAACIVGRLGSTAQKDTVRELLGESSPALVRLRAAQGLLAGGDTSGVPTLIALLTEAPVEEAWQAEELLHWLAGDTAPPALLGACTKHTRVDCWADWRRWYRAHGGKANPAQVLKEPRRPGLLLICADKVYGSVHLCGCDGQPRWHLHRLGEFNDVCLLPGPRVLLAEGNSVREYDLAGETLLKFVPEDDDPLLLSQPLPGSNRLLTTWRHVVEVTRDGKVRHRREMRSRHDSLERSPDGRLVALYPFGRVSGDLRPGLWEIDPVGPEGDRKILYLGRDGEPFRHARAEPLPGGGFLIAGPDLGKVVEIDAVGRTVWQARLNARFATRWRDNRLAFCGDEAGRLVEIDPQGRTVWEAFPVGHVQRVRPCLGLVRLGFSSGELDIDRSGAYRARGLKSKDVAARRRAIGQLREMGRAASDALPALLAALDDADRQIRGGACQALTFLGPKARSAVPRLIDALDNPDERIAFALALRSIGPAAVPALLRAIKDDKRPRVRAGAARTLGLLHDELETVPAELLAALKDSHETVRLEAVRALGSFVARAPVSTHQPDAPARVQVPDAPAREPAVPSLARRDGVAALLDALKDDSMPVRRQAALALASAGPEADRAVPALREALQTGDRELRQNVLRALGALCRRDKTVLPVLLAALRNKDVPDCRSAAAHAVGAMGVNATTAVPALVALLQARADQKGEADQLLCKAVIQALGELGKFNEEAVRGLTALLADDKSEWEALQEPVLQALAQVGPAARSAVPALVKVLRDQPGSVETTMAQALANIGSAAVPELVEELRQGAPRSRLRALACLEAMGRPARTALPGLVGLLRDQGEDVRLAAVQALGGIGPDASTALPALLEALREGRIPAPAGLETLGRIGARHKDVVPLLFEILTDPKKPERDRCAAAWALGLVGPDARDAVPALLDVLRALELADQTPERAGRRELESYVAIPAPIRPTLTTFATDARACALIALAGIGSDARAATSALLKLCVDPTAEPFERWAAAEALARIKPNDAEVIAVLGSVLRDNDTPVPVQVGVVHALAAIGTEAVVPALSDAVNDGDRLVRLVARAALQQVKQRR
jgi:HEAT repeat protein